MRLIQLKHAVRGNYFFYSFALGVILPYLVVYFKEVLGFREREIGLLLMLRPAVALFAQPFWSLLADTGGHRGRLAFILALMAGFLFPWMRLAQGLPLMMTLLVLWSFFNAPLNTLNDAIAFQFLGAQRRIRFANFRLFASLGWIAAMLTIGPFFDRFGIHWLFAVYPLGIAAAACFLWRIPPNEKVNWKQGFHALQIFLRKRHILMFLGAIFLFETANQMGYTFLSLYARTLGATHIQIGWIWGLATVAEVLTMLGFARILRRYPVKSVVVCGMIFTMVRWLPFGLMQTWWELLPFQLLHAFTLTFGYVGAATFMDMESPPKIRFTAQAFYSTVVLNAAAIAGTFLGGEIGYAWGYARLYLVAGLLTGIAALWMMLLVKPPAALENEVD